MTDITPLENTILVHLIEEASEIIKAATKIQRFGKTEVYPGTAITNVQQLGLEIGNFMAVRNLALSNSLINDRDMLDGNMDKQRKMGPEIADARIATAAAENERAG